MNKALLSTLATLLVAVLVHAADKSLPEGKSILTPDLLKSTRLHAGPKPSGEFKVIDVKDQPFKQAIQARVKEKPENPWTVQISTLTTQAVKAGEVVLVSFYVRTVESKNDGGKGERGGHAVIHKAVFGFVAAFFNDLLCRDVAHDIV